MVKGIGATDELPQFAVQFPAKLRILLRGSVGRLQFVQSRYQGLGDKATAVGAIVSMLVRLVIVGHSGLL
jgi:hypothetical protein